MVSTLQGMEMPSDFYHQLRVSGRDLSSYVLFVEVAKQTMKVFHNEKMIKTYTVSTAKNGTGQVMGSGQTPVGLHAVREKFGKKAAPDTIFVGRRNTKERWVSGSKEKKDLILTRIFWLEGLQEGLNRGQDSKKNVVDTYTRMIYIHGTNQETLLGKPVSQGCIRMEKHDVMELFDFIPVGTLVWIEA